MRYLVQELRFDVPVSRKARLDASMLLGRCSSMLFGCTLIFRLRPTSRQLTTFCTPLQGQEVDGEGEGFLAIKRPWPGMMMTIYNNHERFENTYFAQFDGYYCTGDGMGASRLNEVTANVSVRGRSIPALSRSVLLRRVASTTTTRGDARECVRRLDDLHSHN